MYLCTTFSPFFSFARDVYSLLIGSSPFGSDSIAFILPSSPVLRCEHQAAVSKEKGV
jgi:hypothetical protein